MKVTCLAGTRTDLSRRGEIHLRRTRHVDRGRRLSRESLAGSVPTKATSHSGVRLALQIFCGRRGATRDHEPRRDEGSALPIRRGLAATRLETSSFARCATEVESSRRWRRIPTAHSGSFAAPGHERRLRGARIFTKSPSSPSPRKAFSRGNVRRISIFHPCVLRLKTTQ